MSRPIRNPTQVRSILANLALSIEESRARRMGSPTANATPMAHAEPAVSAPTSSAVTPAHPQRAQVPTPAPRLTPRNNDLGSSAGSTPPLRTPSEMFDGGAPRLKAQPKRPS